MRQWLLATVVALGSCTPAGVELTPRHPANPDAPIGHLAGPPAALRPGVAELGDPVAPKTPDDAKPPAHDHAHGSPP